MSIPHKVVFVLDNALADDDVEKLELRIGTISFRLSDAAASTTSGGNAEYLWTSTLTLTVDDMVAVSLSVPDTTPPALESATVEPAGRSITLVFDELMTYTPFFDSFDPTAHFSVTADGNTITVEEYAVHFDPSNLLVADIELNALSPGITRGQLVTVSYTPTTVDDPDPLLQDAAGNAVAAFTTGSGGIPAVVNNVRADLTPPALESRRGPAGRRYHRARLRRGDRRQYLHR